ncbi:hypothetical protein BGHDH14_bgh02318 [Blumeria hordei DH14]|uniref:Low-temperature viability protein ltv1 n=1 Tax=Blumeria graminis f. sp. hordei (strain DH14) TaxID=546991 RepID=N1JPJ0_BLUG1|nr:hypothetical protein BGHDH14_bgh02318 [Blumeria hordei DH14]
MARGKWIDKKTATKFTLVHRSQNDPLIHDTSVSSMILKPTAVPNANIPKKLDELASELGDDVHKIRDNEGEAANHGIYYDDSEYDYMQHLRDLGSGLGDSYFLEAPSIKAKEKGKGKPSLESSLSDMSLEDRAKALLGEELIPADNLVKPSYQSQQDIPDSLAGFQPDMDPRLREVLEALEDDAYIDDDDDIFDKLSNEKEVVENGEHYHESWDAEDSDWDSDVTAKPLNACKDGTNLNSGLDGEVHESEEQWAWMDDFNKFKREQKKIQPHIPSSQLSSVMTTTTNGGRRKKRKGALTNPSSYSMTSSSMVRTEGLSTLDARFEKIEEQYNIDTEDMASISEVSSMASASSTVQGSIRGDFDGIMDEFLGNFSMSGKKHVKKGRYQNGIEQLDEVRKGLGKAIIRSNRVL